MNGYSINKLQIKNFKSLKDIEIDANRVNLFIGEPNTGKSNILEAISIAGYVARRNHDLGDFVRYQYLSNLFYDDLLNLGLEINFDGNFVKIYYENGEYVFDGYHKKENKSMTFDRISNGGRTSARSEFGELIEISKFIKFYRFKNSLKKSVPYNVDSNELSPPFGNNLFDVIYHNNNYRKVVSNLIQEFGYKLHLRPHENAIEFQKTKDDSIISFPFNLLSDTVKNIIFHIMAIESNENSVLLFEEPESHTFPYYTKLLGEKIAKDSNQYFVVTHNPYFFTGVVEKIKSDDINVYATYSKNYETKIKKLEPEQISELLDYDPFLGLDKFYEG